MPDLWMPGATRLDVGDHAPTDGGPAKAIAHITWDDNGTAANPIPLAPYEDLVSYFGRNPAGMKAAPHILWDPFTGRFTQFLPANSRSKSLADSAGGTRTNRAGSVVIQVETLFFPYCQWNGTTYARLVDTPCKGWPELLAWVQSWRVPNTWPMGRPTDFTPHRSEAVWESQAGWYAHAHVPENDHQDPGSWPAFTTSEEDDMPTAAEVAAAVMDYQIEDPRREGTQYVAFKEVVWWTGANSAQANATIAAQSAAISTLAAQVGKDVDTAAVVAAVQTAIAAAVVHVNVTVADHTQGA